MRIGYARVSTTEQNLDLQRDALKRAGCDKRSAVRSGLTLIARGEFSIVIAGLGIALEPRLGPLAAAYVLLLAIAGPILARLS